MRNFPVVAVLRNGEEITDLEHPLFSLYSVSIASCKAALTKRLLSNQTTTIYIVEAAGKVFCELPDKTTMEFYG